MTFFTNRWFICAYPVLQGIPEWTKMFIWSLTECLEVTLYTATLIFVVWPVVNLTFLTLIRDSELMPIHALTRLHSIAACCSPYITGQGVRDLSAGNQNHCWVREPSECADMGHGTTNCTPYISLSQDMCHPIKHYQHQHAKLSHHSWEIGHIVIYVVKRKPCSKHYL